MASKPCLPPTRIPEYAQPAAHPNDPTSFAFFGCADPRLRPALSAFLVHGGYFDLLVEAPAVAANAETTTSAMDTRMRLPRVFLMRSGYRPASVASRPAKPGSPRTRPFHAPGSAAHPGSAEWHA